MDKVVDFIKENQMIKKGDKVLIALSGGPDSVCLLHILYMLKESLHISLGAAHINHLLRGEDSYEDEEYVKTLCLKLGIPCFVKRVDVESIARESGISSEMAGREVRYSFFDSILNSENYTKVAIAHNANDQAETVLMRLMRGTGLEGLVGIRPVRDNIYIRPILCLTRNEVEGYCNYNKLEPRIDKTNLESIYSRNKVRLEMIPFIRNNFNQDIIESLNRLAALANMDNDYITTNVETVYKDLCREKQEKIVINKDAFDIHEALLTRVIRKSIFYVSRSTYNFEMKHIYDIIKLQKTNTGKKINLPNNIVAENSYGDIIISIGKIKHRTNMHYMLLKKDIDAKKIGEMSIEEISYDVILEVNPKNEKIALKGNDLVKYFDYDKISSNIIIRNRKDGDKIRPLGMDGNKKIKDIFIDSKIPSDLRDKIPLVCFDDEIAWVVGLKISDLFKVTKSTKNILQISFKERK